MFYHDFEFNKKNIDYASLEVLKRELKNKYEALGEEAFVGHYQTKFGFYNKVWGSVNQRFLLAVLEYLNPEFRYFGPKTGYLWIILDEGLMERAAAGDWSVVEELERTTPEAFKKYGLLIKPEQLFL